jgi:hypothetical protein
MIRKGTSADFNSMPKSVSRPMFRSLQPSPSYKYTLPTTIPPAKFGW